MTVKDELHLMVDQMDETDAEEVLDYLRWLASESDTLSEEELDQARQGQEQIARGEYVTLAEFRRSLVE